jgi:hypothetical protein
MTERGILFSGAMVRALLDGTKTQTRRACKPMNQWVDQGCREVRMVDGAPHHFLKGAASPIEKLRSPYGQPGDRLWVRETFFAFGRWETRFSEKKKRDEWHFIDMTVECDRAYQYAASNPEVPLAKGRGGMPGWWTRPAIHMPRAASRILLEITGVRVERLQDISEADAAAEGWSRRPEVSNDPQVHADAARDWYMDLWEQINGVGSWSANPWVWVVEFKRVTEPAKGDK